MPGPLAGLTGTWNNFRRQLLEFGGLAGIVATGTAASGAVTLNGSTGTITSESLTTAAGSDYTLTLTNSHIGANDIVLAKCENGSNTTEGMAINRVTEAAGSVVIRVRNTHSATAWNGTIQVSFVVIKQQAASL